MDAKAYPMAMSAKDTSGAPPSIRPVIDATTYVDGGSGCAVSACDITATPGHTMFALGAPDATSSVCYPKTQPPTVPFS
jgi:hypothetical protein